MLKKVTVSLLTTLAVSGQALALSSLISNPALEPTGLTPAQLRQVELCHSMTTTMGAVSRHPLTADGEVDGFVLDQGGVAHVPPHFGQQVATLAPVGADVKVIGQSLPGPDGEKRLHVGGRCNFFIVEQFP